MRKKIQKMMIAGVCLLCLSGCGKSKEAEEQQMTLRSQGMEQALNGDYDAAIASYNKALELADMHVGALEADIAAYKAAALYQQGNAQQAIDTCSAILDLKKSAEIYLTRGLLNREAGDQEAAKADFAAAIELTPEKDKVMLGRLSYYMEDYNKAKEYLESAYKAGDQEALYWEAELYWQMKNEDYAVTLYQEYLEGEPEYQSAYERVASYQMKQGNYDDALATLEAGIALGDKGNLRSLLASEVAVYEYKGDFATAKLKMESYLESYPEDQDAAREYVFLQTR